MVILHPESSLSDVKADIFLSLLFIGKIICINVDLRNLLTTFY